MRRYNIAIKIKKRYQGRQRNVNNDLVNEKIPNHFTQILVIDQEGKKIGMFTKDEAIDEAYRQNLDLVLISNNEKMPVAKIIDYGKYRYEKRKKDHELKKNNRTVEQKELRISVNIGEHDMDVKIKSARRFLEKGNFLKITLIFKGREMRNKELGYEKMKQFLDALSDVSELKKEPMMTGKYYYAYLNPKKQTNK